MEPCSRGGGERRTLPLPTSQRSEGKTIRPQDARASTPSTAGDLPPDDRDLARVYHTYGRLAVVYDLLVHHNEWLWRQRLRRELFARIEKPGRILDAGVATGANIPFYPPGSTVTGIDLSPAMLARAKGRAARHGRRVDLRQASLTATGLAGGSFDCVVASFVLCCVPRTHVDAAFREFRRILVPGGRLYILDYALPQGRWRRSLTRGLAPVLLRAFAAHYDQDLERLVRSSAFYPVERRGYAGGSVQLHVLRRDCHRAALPGERRNGHGQEHRPREGRNDGSPGRGHVPS